MARQRIRSYAQALSYLYSYTDFEQKPAHLFAAANFDLQRVEDLLARLASPQRRFQSLHVAGTKGKGSVVAITAAALRAAGYRTGSFTSPHLHTFCERIRVDGQLIDRQQVTELVDEMVPALEAVSHLTTFEIITALAFLYFARQEIEFAVVEVGLGGRLDATNVIEPLVAAITSLSLDHTYVLGDSVAAIAREKAGIVKPGVPVVSAPQPVEAQRVIEEMCRQRGAPLTVVGRDWRWTPEEATLEGQIFRVTSSLPGAEDLCRQSYRLPLLGRHQLINATVSIAALHALRWQGTDFSAEDVARGMGQVEWPARFEVLSHDMPLVVDGAHNPESARRLGQALRDYFPGRKVVFIFGVSADKDATGMLQELQPVMRRLIVMQSTHPRAAPVEIMLSQVRQQGWEAAMARDARRALDLALDVREPGDVICAAGSLFVAGEIRLAWMQRAGVKPLPPTDGA